MIKLWNLLSQEKTSQGESHITFSVYVKWIFSFDFPLKSKRLVDTNIGVTEDIQYISIYKFRLVETEGTKGATALSPQIFQKIKIVKKKKKKETSSNSSKTTGNIIFVHFI